MKDVNQLLWKEPWISQLQQTIYAFFKHKTSKAHKTCELLFYFFKENQPNLMINLSRSQRFLQEMQDRLKKFLRKGSREILMNDSSDKKSNSKTFLDKGSHWATINIWDIECLTDESEKFYVRLRLQLIGETILLAQEKILSVVKKGIWSLIDKLLKMNYSITRLSVFTYSFHG